MTQVKGISAMLVALVQVCVMLVDVFEVVNLVMHGTSDVLSSNRLSL